MVIKSADLILLNGDIRTQDAALPKAESLAVAKGRIIALDVGPGHKHLAGSGTTVIDLGGRLVMPGFIDSHFYFYDWALARAGLQLDQLASLADTLEAVKKTAAALPAGEWITGLGFNECFWPENRIPTRRELDQAAPHHPVLVRRCDMHLAVANSIALHKAGIGPASVAPSGGIISRDSAGNPDGILRERAIDLVSDVLPQPRTEDVLAAMLHGISELHTLGITGLHDFRLMDPCQSALALSAWRRLAAEKLLSLRAWVTLSGDQLEDAILGGLRTGSGDDRLRIGHVKYFADGGMGARTAWMHEPYLDGGSGQPVVPIEQIENAVERAAAAGLAVSVHAVGDRANSEVISLFEFQALKNAKAGAPPQAPALAHRIEHLQMIRPDDLQRLGGLSLTACVQPPNLPMDMKMIDAAVGAAGRHAYAFRNIIDSGIPTCFSSDAPVCDPNPLLGIHAAVTRQLSGGQTGKSWYPDQCLSVDEAVAGYTATPAQTSGCGHALGSISVGKMADLIVFDQNIFTISHQHIAGARVVLTVFD